MSRPREYDEAALVSLAMQTFWSGGYRGTSIEELVAQTGVSRASLYSAYAGKRRLFIESIRLYLERVVDDNVRRLAEVEPADQAVRQFFSAIAEAPVARLRRGCLLTNSAAELGRRDVEIARLIRTALKRVEGALQRRLVEAKESGTLHPDVDPRAYARQLITLLQGIRVMARVDVERAVLRDAVAMALFPLRTGAAAQRTGGTRARRASRGQT